MLFFTYQSTNQSVSQLISQSVSQLISQSRSFIVSKSVSERWPIILLQKVVWFKTYLPDKARTWGQTDGRTNGQSSFSAPPPSFSTALMTILQTAPTLISPPLLQKVVWFWRYLLDKTQTHEDRQTEGQTDSYFSTLPPSFSTGVIIITIIQTAPTLISLPLLQKVL